MKPTSGAGQVDLPVPGSRQAGRHDRFLPVADPQRQGSEAVSEQRPCESLKHWEKLRAQYRQSAELWCSDHRIEARRKAGPGDGPPAGSISSNVIEADHGKLKILIKPVRGFQIDPTAYATIQGFEVMRALRKGSGSPLVPAARHQGRGAPVERAFAALGPRR